MSAASRLRLLPWLVAALGCCIAWYPTLASGFASLQSDPGDTRFVHYVLEHGWLWLTGAPGHGDLFSPPFFYPEPNVLAYSETLLGAAPPYWLLRAAGVGAGTSFQVWQILLGLLNFAAMHVWLRRRFGLGTAAAAAGAFLFAFANPRSGQIGHIQLHPQFWSIGCIEAAWRVLDGRSGRWALAAAACAAAQFWSSFYLAWFLAASFVFAGVAALALAATSRRRREAMGAALARAGRAWPWWLGAAALGALLVEPLAVHYRAAASVVGMRGYDAVYAPVAWNWVLAGPENVEGSWILGLGAFTHVPMHVDVELGVGLVTTAAIAAGLLLGVRAGRVPALLVATGVVWVLLATEFPLRIHFWRTVFDALPGAPAIRALGRAGFAVAPLGAIGLACAFERAARRPWLAVLLAAAVAFEQVREQPSFDREEVERIPRALAAEVRRRGCRYFYYAPRGRDVPFWHVHLDAMWAGLLAGVPTVNGYSGNRPPGWYGGEPPNRSEIQPWADRHGLDLSGDALIE